MARSKGRSRSAKPDALIGQLGSLLWPPSAATTRRQAVVLAYDADNKHHTVLVELEEGTHELKLEEVDFQPTPAEAWGEDVVGSPVIVCWLNEPSPMWFEGSILAYNPEVQTHKVAYVNDAEEEECPHLPHSETRRAVLLTNMWRRTLGQQGVLTIKEMRTDLQAALTDAAAKERCAFLYGGATADEVMECSRLLPLVLGVKQQDGEDDMQVPEPLVQQHMEVDDQQRVWQEDQQQEGEEQMEGFLGELPGEQQAEADEEQQSSLEQAPQPQRRALLGSKRQKGANQQHHSMQLRNPSPAGNNSPKQEGADDDCAPQGSSPPPEAALRRPLKKADQHASKASPTKMAAGKDTPQPATKASMLPVHADRRQAAAQGAAAAAPGVAAVPAPTARRELRARPGPGVMPASTSAAGLGAGSLLGKRVHGGKPRVKDEAGGLEQQQQQPQQQEQQQGDKQKARRGRPPKQQGADHSNAGCPPAKRRRVSQAAGSDTAVPQGSTVLAASAAVSIVAAEPLQSRRVAARPQRAAAQQAQAQAAAAEAMEEEQDGREEEEKEEEVEEGGARIPAVLQPLMQRFAALEPTAITAKERERNMENWARHRDAKLSKALFYQLPHQRIAKGHGLMFELCANKRAQAGSSISRAMLLSPGELELVQQHRGVNTGHYLHVAEHDGKAVTTSCHQCQHQHVTYRCQANHTSVCNICISAHYPGMSVEAMVGAKCPQCLGICVCRACLRKEVGYAAPSWDEKERRFFADYSLTCLGRHLLQWYNEEIKEVAYDGLRSLLEVPQSHEAGDRACCDRCGTSISNLLRSCSKCEWDICRHCCAELRAANQWSSGATASSTEAAPQAEAPALQAHTSSRGTARTRAEAEPSGSMDSGATTGRGSSRRSRGATQANLAPAAGGTAAATQGSPMRRRGAAAAVAAEAVVGQAARTRSRLAQASGPGAGCSPGTAGGAAVSGGGSRSARSDGAAPAPTAAADGQQHDAACTTGRCPGCDEPATFVPQRFFSDDWCLKLEKAAEAYGNKHTLQALELQPPGATQEDLAMETAAGATGAAPAGSAAWRQSGSNGTAQQRTATGSQVADMDAVDGASGSGGERPGCVFAFQRWVRESWVRKAACGAEEQYLFTPTAEEVETDERAKAIFRWCMAHSVPVIVRNCQSRIPWNPQCMQRALKDGRGRAGQDDEEGMLVVDCSDGHVELSGVSAYDFFNAYEHTHTLAQVLGTKQSGPARASAGTSSNSTAQDKGAAAGEAAAAAAPAAKGQPKPKKVRYEALLSKLLKLKDWPPGHNFAAKLQRHNQDFKEMLPCRAWTLYQGSSPLNAATQLPEGFNPPDLGPKTYIAYGMQEEVEDRDVNCGTKLHQDLSSAVNMLLHAHRQATRLDGSPWEEHTVRCGTQEADEHTWNDAPALWTIGRVDDAAKVRDYLLANVDSFSHHGGPVPKELLLDAVYQQAFMLTKRHREALAAQGVYLWAFEQHEQEAVFVPAGAPHQVRNMRSCIKVAVDFVPPEAFDQLVTLRQQLRRLDMQASKCGKEGEKAVDRTFTDKLQGETCMLAAAVGAWETLTGGRSGGD